MKENEIRKQPEQVSYASRNLWCGVLLGLGAVAFIDEAVFHQLLHWHHFYDGSTMKIGLVSDGFFHAFSWFATIGGAFLLADLHRRHAFWFKRWAAGIFLGAGGFQVYDGIIQHKLMRLHQIRYDVDLLPYDLVWNILGASLLIIGLLLFQQSKRRSGRNGGKVLHET